MMYTFTYPFIQKLIYRYGNIPINLMLVLHIIFSFYMISKEWYFPIYVLFNLAILFIVNKYFLKTYKLFPFKITVNNEKIICENFFLSRKKIEIYHQNVNKIRGGIFSGYLTRPIYITDGKQNITIGFYPHAGNFNKLLTIILQNIPQKLYSELIKEIKTRGTDLRSGGKTKKPAN